MTKKTPVDEYVPEDAFGPTSDGPVLKKLVEEFYDGEEVEEYVDPRNNPKKAILHKFKRE